MTAGRDLRSAIARDGCVRVRGLVPRTLIADLARAFADGGSRRDLLTVPAVRRLIAAPGVRAAVACVLGSRASAVRGLLIDKRAGADWALPWHQDRVVAVIARRGTGGFSGWSLKDGVPHALAPEAVLGRMLALRLHLDACAGDSGALRVVPGSHRHGILDDEGAQRLVARTTATVFAARVGDVVLMRPLTLHASARAERAQPRRVVHIDFAVGALPGDARWCERVR